MARSALVAAVATLLVLGAAAGDSKNSGSSNKNSGSSDKASAAANKAASAKLKPGPVCTATKDAFKSYNSCATFREEIWCVFASLTDGERALSVPSSSSPRQLLTATAPIQSPFPPPTYTMKLPDPVGLLRHAE